MIPTKISGNRITKLSQSSTGGFECFVAHKDMGKFSRNGMNNWCRYYTKRTRRFIKKETIKDLEYGETL